MEYHVHNGVDTPNIDPRDLLGFPVYTFTTTTLRDTFLNNNRASEGTIIFIYVTTGTVYQMQVRINKGWRAVTLT